MMRTSRETIYKRFLIFICRIVGEMLGLEFCGAIGLVILTANLLKDKIPKTEKETEMIELQNYKSGSYNSL